MADRWWSRNKGRTPVRCAAIHGVVNIGEKVCPESCWLCTIFKVQGTMCKEQGARNNVQETRCKEQGERYKVLHAASVVAIVWELLHHEGKKFTQVLKGVFTSGLVDTLHYWLRPIKGGQFRLGNFASHFICVQIFQIDFPLILYL